MLEADVMKNGEEFWKIRSESYNNLNWVKDDDYIKTIINALQPHSNDIILDMGTGTGVIAHALSPKVKEVIGLDKSQDMLEHSNWKDNKYFIKRDIINPIFHENVFDKITARMVFHHIIEDTDKAMKECYRILKKGGKMLVAEGIPPDDRLIGEYRKIFELKEKRIVFTETSLRDLMKVAGFKNIKNTYYISKNFSLNNWLSNSGLSEEIQTKIKDLHLNASELFKECYKLRVVGGDCIIETKNLILIGEK